MAETYLNQSGLSYFFLAEAKGPVYRHREPAAEHDHRL